MFVRDAGDAWQVVLQPDHADLSGALAERWADRGPRHESAVLAAYRHDDGWAVWERSPLVDGAGTPVNFIDVMIPSHLAFYRACISAVTGEDPYAGLLVSMHGAGIYRQRYGADPNLRMSCRDEDLPLVEAFVAEQEGSYGARRAEAGIDEDTAWADYRRLQHYDRFSLSVCLRDLDGGDAFEVGEFRFDPAGPWRVRVDPYPLVEQPVTLPLLRRLVPKRSWTQTEFRRAFPELPVETVEVTFVA